jgi:O-acetylserine/cysteine efflux transporter
VLLAPVVAMVSAWLLLDQAPNAAETAGGVLLLVGALVALRPRPAVPRGLADEPVLTARR